MGRSSPPAPRMVKPAPKRRIMQGRTNVCGSDEGRLVEAFEMRAGIVGGPAQSGAGLSRDIAKGEAAEKGLDAFISQRHRQRVQTEGERLEEAAFVETTRREGARQRQGEARGGLAMCRHLQAVYARRSEEWGRQGDELEGGAA